MLPKWDESYSVHNAKIDAQHKKLFELAAKVEYMFDKPVYKEELKSLLADFFNYMKDHFNDEEKYMKIISYPDLEEHRKIHKEIIQSMIDLIKNIKSTNDLKEKLYVVVKKWLLEHILYEDMKVEQYRRSCLASEKEEEVHFSFEKEVPMQEVSKEDLNAIYFYTCECIGQLHDVPYKIHLKIQNKEDRFKCKKCKHILEFYKKYTGNL